MAHIRDSARTYGKSNPIDAFGGGSGVSAHLESCSNSSLVRRLALRLVKHLRTLTTEIDALAVEITERVTIVASSLLAIVGCSALTAAKIVGETAQVHRFRSKDAFARLNGTVNRPGFDAHLFTGVQPRIGLCL